MLIPIFVHCDRNVNLQPVFFYHHDIFFIKLDNMSIAYRYVFPRRKQNIHIALILYNVGPTSLALIPT